MKGQERDEIMQPQNEGPSFYDEQDFNFMFINCDSVLW